MTLERLPEELDEKRLRMFAVYTQTFCELVGFPLDDIEVDVPNQRIILESKYAILPPRKFNNSFWIYERVAGYKEYDELVGTESSMAGIVEHVINELISNRAIKAYNKLKKQKRFADVDLQM